MPRMPTRRRLWTRRSISYEIFFTSPGCSVKDGLCRAENGPMAPIKAKDSQWKDSVEEKSVAVNRPRELKVAP